MVEFGRFESYLLAAAAGSLAYFTGAAGAVLLVGPGLVNSGIPSPALSISDMIASSMADAVFLAGLLCVVFITATILMFLPWCCVVWLFTRTRRSSMADYSAASAVAALVTGSLFFSVIPKPLFVEDQTFLQSLDITLVRQGWLLLLSGFTGGFFYWFLEER